MSFGLDIDLTVGDVSMFVSAENIGARTRFGIEKALWRSGKDIKKEFSKQVLAKNKTGRLYIRKNAAGSRRRHIASAPGETPANRTGFYRKSFGFTVAAYDNLIIGNTAPYAGWLEKGTKNKSGGTRMAARPGLLNSINASQRDILRNLSKGIESAL